MARGAGGGGRGEAGVGKRTPGTRLCWSDQKLFPPPTQTFRLGHARSLPSVTKIADTLVRK